MERTTSNIAVSVNLDDPVGKTVGRRRVRTDSLNPAVDSKRAARAWRRAFPTPFAGRGVYRFTSHEEADRWMWKTITRKS
jgi:hypothetical protein